MTTKTASLPRKIDLPAGATVTLRQMTPDDRDGLLALANSLPADDLLFLRRDITQPAAVDEWLEDTRAGRSTTVVADDGKGLGGYAALHHNQTTWTRHMGEIRVIVSPSYRTQKLGRRLVEEAVRLANEMGLQKLTAQMTLDQVGARAVFERLGFQVEALLADWVVDRDGRPRDLLIMSRDVTGLSDSID